MAGSTLKLKQKRSQDRRARIVAAATRLFGRRGIAGTSLTDIAKLAKVPLPSFYDYFRDKDDLVAAVPEENYLALYEQLTATGDEAEPRRQLRAIYLGEPRVHPRQSRLGPRVLPRNLAERRDRRGAHPQRGRPLCAALRRADPRARSPRAPTTSDLDPYLAMSVLMGGMCQLTAVWLLYRRPYDLVERGSRAVRPAGAVVPAADAQVNAGTAPLRGAHDHEYERHGVARSQRRTRYKVSGPYDATASRVLLPDVGPLYIELDAVAIRI